MARRRVNTTKYEIIQQATSLFLEVGYSATTPKMVCDALDISTGNLTYYFPTKEHLLAVLIEMLCKFQGETIQHMVRDDGMSSLLAVCLEMATMAAMAEENEIARDLFVSAYSSVMCLEIIRRNDAQRAKRIYREFCTDWNEQQFLEAETLVSGIEYATLMITDYTAPLEVRIRGALNSIMMIYNVPQDIREVKINKAFSLDYRSLGRQLLDSFRQFVNETNEHTFEMLLNNTHDSVN